MANNHESDMSRGELRYLSMERNRRFRLLLNSIPSKGPSFPPYHHYSSFDPRFTQAEYRNSRFMEQAQLLMNKFEEFFPFMKVSPECLMYIKDVLRVDTGLGIPREPDQEVSEVVGEDSVYRRLATIIDLKHPNGSGLFEGNSASRIEKDLYNYWKRSFNFRKKTNQHLNDLDITLEQNWKIPSFIQRLRRIR